MPAVPSCPGLWSGRALAHEVLCTYTTLSKDRCWPPPSGSVRSSNCSAPSKATAVKTPQDVKISTCSRSKVDCGLSKSSGPPRSARGDHPGPVRRVAGRRSQGLEEGGTMLCGGGGTVPGIGSLCDRKWERTPAGSPRTQPFQAPAKVPAQA